MTSKADLADQTTIQASESGGVSNAPGVGPVLTVVYSPDPSVMGLTIPLDGEMVVVGRGVSTGGVAANDLAMSRLHCRIAFDARSRQYRVGDAQSQNGTFVNGDRIQAAMLREGDVLRAGDTLLACALPSQLTKLQEQVKRLAPATLSVMLLGETGTGKERLARGIHDESGRGGRFMAINCAALPKDLLLVELFGHTRGAFSGAGQSRQGLFVAADGGTLFLDEIGDLSLDLQATLLRALQEGSVRAVGSDDERKIDVRIVAATHANLERLVEEEKFRGDLFARLAGAIVRVPPLRERRTEVVSLVHEFVAANDGPSDFRLTPDAAECLLRWRYPFNVRELESLVRAWAVLRAGPALDLPYLRERHPEIAAGFRRTEDVIDSGSNGGADPRRALEALLRKHHGNVSAAAKESGKARSQFYRMLRSFGMDPGRYR